MINIIFTNNEKRGNMKYESYFFVWVFQNNLLLSMLKAYKNLRLLPSFSLVVIVQGQVHVLWFTDTLMHVLVCGTTIIDATRVHLVRTLRCW